MSKNLAQIYATNPITVIGDTDLLYVDVTGTTDAGIAGSDLIAQFSSIPGPIVAGDSGTDSAQGPTSSSTADFAFSYGSSCQASGTNSYSFGNFAIASGNQSFAYGDGTNNGGDFSFAFGHGGTNVTGGGTDCFVFGNAAVTAGSISYAVAWGSSAFATHSGSWTVNDGVIIGQDDTDVGQFVLSFTNGLHLNGGSINVKTIGSGLRIAEGTNAKQGIATMSGGTATVNNTSVTANSRIFLTSQDDAVTGALRAPSSSVIVGTSFVINSSIALDAGNVAYEIFEPAV